MTPLLPQQEVRHAGRPTFSILGRDSVVNPDQPVGSVIGQRTEENSVYDTKNRCRRADTNCKGEDRYPSEAKAAAHGTQPVEKVSNHLLKHGHAPFDSLTLEGPCG